MALSVPLSRFTSRVGGGSAFYVRPHYTFVNKRTMKVVRVSSLLLAGYFAAYFLSVDVYYSSKIRFPTGVTLPPGEPDASYRSACLPYYRPCNAGIVQAFFSPAHFLDARLFHPSRWDG